MAIGGGQLSQHVVDALLVTAFAFTVGSVLASGGIGTDATLVPQEAMRLLAGQTMYRDFYASFGPISAFVYLPFLLLAPTGGWAHLLASGALNAAGAFCVWAILRRCALPRLHTLLGGALTGCWFSAQFGGVLYDYISFVFVLGAAVVYASPKDSARRGVAIGVLVALGLLTKQTTGPLATLALITGAFAAEGTALLRSRVVHWALLGCGATFGCVYGVIAACGVWADYVEAVFVLPFGFRSDPSKHPLRLLLVWLVPFLIDPSAMLREFGLGRLLFYPAVLVIYAAYYTAFRKWTTFFAELPTRRFAFVFFVCSTLLCSSVFARLFTNLTWGLWGALMLICAAWRLERRTVWASAALFFGIAGVQSWKRMRLFDESTLAVPAHHDFRPVRVVDWPELAYGTALRGATNLMSTLPNGGIGTPSYAFIDDGLSLLPLIIGTAPSNWPTEYVDGQTLPREPRARHAWQLEFIRLLESTRTEWVFSAFDAMPYPLRDPTLSGAEAWNSLPVLRDYLSCAYTNHREADGVRLSKRKPAAQCKPVALTSLARYSQ